jgi:hypothetical protein
MKAASTSDTCEVKIENGAHSTMGKLITRLCKKRNLNSGNKHKKTTSQAHEYESLNENENEPDADDAGATNPFDKPFQREYILRSSTSRPAPYSRQSPQRMYVNLSKEEFRIAGAFTEDTMFF